MDFYGLFQSKGKEAKIVRVTRVTDAATGQIHRSRVYEEGMAVEVPATWSLRQQKTSYVDANLFLLFDAYALQDSPLYPIVPDDYVVWDKMAYQIKDVTTIEEDDVPAVLMSLFVVKGSTPFNIEEVSSV